MGKQRPRRRCCLRAQVASENVSNWRNTYLFHTELERGKTEGDTNPTAWVCSIQVKISCQRVKAGPHELSPRAAWRWHSSCPPAAPGSLRAAAAASTPSSEGTSSSNSPCSFLRLLQAQLTLASGQIKGAWKLPVRQWECTTGKDKLEEVSRTRASELCYPFSTSSL